MMKIVNKLLTVFFYVLSLFLISCTSNVDVAVNTEIMNIWVAPEYAEASKLSHDNYIAVFITHSSYFSETGIEEPVDAVN